MLKKTLLITTCLFGFLFAHASVHADPAQFNVLLFTKMEGWHHKAVNEGVTAMRELSEKHHFSMDWHEDPNTFTDENLEKYDAVVFMLNTGNVLNEEQQGAMERFIQAGNGFVGVHSASDTHYDWEWYTKLVGRMFVIHPPIQTAQLEVLDSSFPGMERMPKKFWFTDEYYEFGPEKVEGLNYILAIDENTYDPSADWGRVAGDGMGEFHPLAWYHEYDGGRSFYTALGHVPAVYKDTLFLEHLFGGLMWAATGKGLSE